MGNTYRRENRMSQPMTTTASTVATHSAAKPSASGSSHRARGPKGDLSAGMGWAFTRYSSDYISQERAAIGAGLGVRAHNCEKPWDWRARNRGERAERYRGA
jgi:hypothetical protein